MNTIRRASASLLALLASAGAAFAADPAAEIVSLEGKGEYREPQQASWIPAKMKQALFPANFVRTGDASRMAILFKDRTQMRLSQNSTMQIKEAATAAGGKTTINLQSGRSWTQSRSVPQGLTMETPSALAAIRGTDWDMAVDAEGTAILTVLSGEVEFYNDKGRVLVGREEQARARKGQAPEKLIIRNPRDRVQWVSSFTADPGRHGPPSPAASALQAADNAVFGGDFARAREILAAGKAQSPGDERFDVSLARIALLDADAKGARSAADAALAINPRSAAALVTLGDVERFEGRRGPAVEAYTRAAQLAAPPADAWIGLGIVERSRGNPAPAMELLGKALAIEPGSARAQAELGAARSGAQLPMLAREAYERALALQPDNYVALAGLGALELEQGQAEAGMDHLLKANLIEPRYARAHLLLAAAYYREGRMGAARESMERAMREDPNDPVPYVFRSLMAQDTLDLSAAVASSQEALSRIPFLKSLDEIADNQKGIANVGSGLGAMGLEFWARHAANESYLPFWGGSHLFLADRYPGEFARRSELMQGFITDPLAFGASNRFQSMYRAPGHYATVSYRYNQTDDLKLREPVANVNGMFAGERPAAYFIEAIGTRIDPGNSALSATGKTFTGGFGLRPRHDLGLFFYVNRFDADFELGTPGVTGDFYRISGLVTRLDTGLRYALNADNSLWFKAGSGQQDSRVDQRTSIELPGVSLGRQVDFTTTPDAKDAQVRQTFLLAGGVEVTWGALHARSETPRTLVQEAQFHFNPGTSPLDRLDAIDVDTHDAAQVRARYSAGGWRFEGALGYSRYRKERRFDFNGVTVGTAQTTENYDRNVFEPEVGVVRDFGDGWHARGACRRWIRSTALDTLMPVGGSGIPVDDQLVIAGGTQEQCRGQVEWKASPRLFAMAFAEQVRVENLVSPLDGVLNSGSDLTNLDRLRNRVLAPPQRPDVLEDTPVYGRGKVSRAGAGVESVVLKSLALRADYTAASTENSNPVFAGRWVPYISRHRVNLGATWTPGWRTFVNAQAAYRTYRFADEANTVRLPTGWDLAFNAFVESPDKRWALEVYGSGLAKKETSDLFGAVVTLRF